MSEMEQSQETLPQQKPLEMNSALESTAESGPTQTADNEQDSKISPPQQTMEMNSSPVSSTTPGTFRIRLCRNRASWVNIFWADVSGQLRRLSVISNNLFGGLLLKRETDLGSLLLKELRKKYDEFGDDRNLVTVRVLYPEKPTDKLWQLLWTIKRHRNPNGRQVLSETKIDPIDNRSHLQIDTNTGHTHSITDFSLPSFIQDYGPGPAEFNPEPEDDFDARVRRILTDVNAGMGGG